MYCNMIYGAYFVYTRSGGSIGSLDTDHLYSYFLALVAYFVLNATFIGIFYLISIRTNFYKVIRVILKDSMIAYIITLTLSLSLLMMIQSDFNFGLFLFLTISVLLSLAFKQLFGIYQEVSNKATRDQRTGLYNHGYFEELFDGELVKCKANKEPLSLIIIDLDNFKKYNDTFGHLKGDKLLEFFGKTLLQECKPHRYILARYGGEEFTILMPGKLEKEAFSFINAVRKKVNDTFFEGVEIFPHGCLSFSAGIAGYRQGTVDKSELLDKADQAMYYAKAQGRNAVHIYNEQSIVQKNIDIEKDITDIEQQLKIFLFKDVYTFQHSKRVFHYAKDFAEQVNLGDAERKTLILGALFHDIGKLEIPKELLKKKEKLTFDEWETVKRHVEWGREIVASIDKYKELLPLVEMHHERMDGKGYPYGLQGEEIPKLVRILSVIDAFDAMTTERPYQVTRTFAEAVEELRRCAGNQFDPAMVDEFIQMLYNKYDLLLTPQSAAAVD